MAGCCARPVKGRGKRPVECQRCEQRRFAFRLGAQQPINRIAVGLAVGARELGQAAAMALEAQLPDAGDTDMHGAPRVGPQTRHGVGEALRFEPPPQQAVAVQQVAVHSTSAGEFTSGPSGSASQSASSSAVIGSSSASGSLRGPGWRRRPAQPGGRSSCSTQDSTASAVLRA